MRETVHDVPCKKQNDRESVNEQLTQTADVFATAVVSPLDNNKSARYEPVCPVTPKTNATLASTAARTSLRRSSSTISPLHARASVTDGHRRRDDDDDGRGAFGDRRLGEITRIDTKRDVFAFSSSANDFSGVVFNFRYQYLFLYINEDNMNKLCKAPPPPHTIGSHQ
jgi:hypothetical protein